MKKSFPVFLLAIAACIVFAFAGKPALKRGPASFGGAGSSVDVASSGAAASPPEAMFEIAPSAANGMARGAVVSFPLLV